MPQYYKKVSKSGIVSYWKEDKGKKKRVTKEEALPHIFSEKKSKTITIETNEVSNKVSKSETITVRLVEKQEIITEYPYKKLFTSEEEIKERFTNLQKFEFDFEYRPYKIFSLKDVVENRLLYCGKYTLVKIEGKNYYLYDNISDYFQEHVRIKSKRKDQEFSPFEYYHSTKPKLGKWMKVSEIEREREALYKNYYECTSFKPSLMVGFGKFIANRLNIETSELKILDISSGWGDRLIGAIALKAKYVGVDPNRELVKGYDEIISSFSTNKKNYKMICEDFREVDLKKTKFNLVFTSPPYFDLEEYSIGTDEQDKKKQSTFRTKNSGEWLEKFLIPSLRKAWNCLEDGGYMIVNLNEYKNDCYIFSFLKECDRFPSSFYEGCISQYTPIGGKIKKSPQPFWIWRKRVSVSPERIDENVYNPKLNINEMKTSKGMRVHVVNDDMLICGTKQRGLVKYMAEHAKGKELVYASSTSGMAQAALAYAGKLTSTLVTIFTVFQRPISPQVNLAIQLGAKVVEIRSQHKAMRDIYPELNGYLSYDSNRIELKLGVNDEDYISASVKMIKRAAKDTYIGDFKKKYTFWLVGGSGVLTKILHTIYKNSEFRVVQIGKDFDEEVRELDRVTFYKSSLGFYQDAEIKPPYDSAIKYDAKVWEFVEQYASKKDKNIVWNVAKDPNM